MAITHRQVIGAGFEGISSPRGELFRELGYRLAHLGELDCAVIITASGAEFKISEREEIKKVLVYLDAHLR